MSNLHKSSISSPPSNPLFSTIITLYTLILLYFPTAFLFSPLFFSASFILLSLLRLRATRENEYNSEEFVSGQAPVLRDNSDHDYKWESLESSVDFNTERDPGPKPNFEKPVSSQPSLSLVSRDSDHDYKWVSRVSTVDSNTQGDPDFAPYPKADPGPLYPLANVESSSEQEPKIDPDTLSNEPTVESSTEQDPEIDLKPDPASFSAESFVEWNVRAPLEVIQEEYEGEEETGVNERYASLSLYYPEMDTDSSSGGDSPVIENWDSPENVGFRWEEGEEEDREGLIEIELDGKGNNSEVEEENLIEIDLNFPAR